MIKLKIADYITLGNLLSGLISIYFSATGNYLYAAIAIILGVGFDYFDGKVARLLKQESKLGAQLDSFSDAITFGAAVAFMLYFSHPSNYFGILLLLFVTCGVLRLARYNVESANKKGPTKYFKGTPITINGIVFPLLVILNVNFYIILGAVIILSYTMISNLKIKHL